MATPVSPDKPADGVPMSPDSAFPEEPSDIRLSSPSRAGATPSEVGTTTTSNGDGSSVDQLLGSTQKEASLELNSTKLKAEDGVGVAALDEAARLTEEGGEPGDPVFEDGANAADAPGDDIDNDNNNGKSKPLPEKFWPRVWYRIREFFYPSAIVEGPKITRRLLGKYNDKLVRVFTKWPAWGRWLFLTVFYLAWFGTMATITYFSSYKTSVIPNPGDEPVDPQWIGCYTNLWSRNGDCGVDGRYCQPFDNVSYTLRCGPKCLLAKTGEQYWIGNDTVNKEPVVVGSGPYRADSWICLAAMQQGLVTDRSGGCLVVDLVGEASNYTGINQYGVKSESFPSQFPKSYNVRACASSPSCADLAWASLMAAGIFAFFAATLTPSSSAVYYGALTVAGFFWVIFGDYSAPRGNDDFLSKAFAQIIPTLACSYFMYEITVKTVLPEMIPTMGLDVFIFYALPWILGLDLVELLTYLPDLTLTAKALQDPAQVGMLIATVIIIGGFAIYFLYWQRKLRRLPIMVLIYGIFFLIFFTLPLMFNLYPHLHHYMVALLLMPLPTGIQTRPAFVFQGFCVGWFLEGVGRWGFDTPAETVQRFVGAGLWNSATPSWDNMSTLAWAQNGTLTWTFPKDGVDYTDLTSYDAQQGAGITSYIMLQNDFNIYQGQLANTSANTETFNLTANNGTVPFFFRVAGVQSDGTVLDYSDVLTAYGNGTISFPNGSWWWPD